MMIGRNSSSRFFSTCALLCIASLVQAQGTVSDYQRAEGLRKRNGSKVFKAKIGPHWFAGNSRFWYRNTLSEGKREFVLVNVTKGTRQPAFDHQKLATALSKVTSNECKQSRLPFKEIEFLDTGNVIAFRIAGKHWVCDLDDYSIATDQRPVEAKKPRSRNEQSGRRRGRSGRQRGRNSRSSSPDGKWTAFIKEYNLFVKAKQTGEEFALSTNGIEDDFYEGRFYWSPDSDKLVVMRKQPEQKHIVSFVETAPKEKLQPKLHSFQYLKPGDKIAISKPHLFDIADKKERPVDDGLFPTPWRINEIHWNPNSLGFTFLYNQRGHQILRIVGVDAESGKTRSVIDEQSKTFVDYAYKKFTHYLDDTNEIIWMSERDGWNHLYLYDSKTDQVINQITQGNWVVRGVERVDEKTRQIWFRASGIDPQQDPYYIHYCRINFDGTGLTRLTTGNGTHEIEYSPDSKTLKDTYSRVDLPPVTELRRAADGKLVCELERADASELLKTGWNFPERFVSKSRDGSSDIHGVIFRPEDFDPNKKYPVIEKIYAGPHGSFVPKSFRSFFDTQPIAELGFIVVQIDGMGTSNRSKAFHDVCWKNIGDSGFPDRILWMKAAAEKYSSLDITRVGIYGGSAGGQSSTRAMLAYPDFYSAAVSVCGCHDNRMDKIWWNELWMGWPVGKHYDEQSNVTNAHKLQGKLFLIVGEMDRNVDPASTFQVVNALIKADKDFDLLVIPGGGHGIGGSYGIRRRRDFFVRHLLGVEPRSQP